MKATRATVFGLAKFGVTPAELASLANVKIKLLVLLRHVDEKQLFQFDPKQRLEKMKAHYRLLHSRVKRNWVYGPVKTSWIRRQPRGFDARVEARYVPRISRMPEIDHIWISEVPGRKRARAKPRDIWFGVKARIAIQVEGQKNGMQSYEDRILIVKATSPHEAERKLQPVFKLWARPYLNPHGFMVRWAFERILDVYEIGDEKMDPKGVEVFSVLARRRMKSELAWNPRQKEQTAQR